MLVVGHGTVLSAGRSAEATVDGIDYDAMLGTACRLTTLVCCLRGRRETHDVEIVIAAPGARQSGPDLRDWSAALRAASLAGRGRLAPLGEIDAVRTTTVPAAQQPGLQLADVVLHAFGLGAAWQAGVGLAEARRLTTDSLLRRARRVRLPPDRLWVAGVGEASRWLAQAVQTAASRSDSADPGAAIASALADRIPPDGNVMAAVERAEVLRDWLLGPAQRRRATPTGMERPR